MTLETRIIHEVLLTFENNMIIYANFKTCNAIDCTMTMK